MPKSCAIVGAGEGLGASLARKFCAEGMDLALFSRTQAGSADAIRAAEQARQGARVQHFAIDASEPEKLEQTVAAAADDFGGFDVLIYNVRDAFDMVDPIDLPYDKLEYIFRLEVVGALAAAKAVLPAMRARGDGTVLFSSSTAAYRGSGKMPHYAIGKFGLRALSQGLTRAYSKDGIHIVHVRLDCDLDVPVMHARYGDNYDREKLAQADDVALAYWHCYLQPRSAWSNEIELRPYSETWTF